MGFRIRDLHKGVEGLGFKELKQHPFFSGGGGLG